MCPDREILSAYLDGEIEPRWQGVLAAHLVGCADCRAWYEAMARTRQALMADAPDPVEPMERVRLAVLSRIPPASRPVPAWRRPIAVPLPVAVLAAAAFLALGVSLALAVARTNVGFIRVTRASTGGTEYQFAVPADKVEALLKSVGGQDAADDTVIMLPKNVRLIPVGQPRMGKAADFPRKKP
jgi:predicted anti-sigma-YlaC factor YlaD